MRGDMVKMLEYEAKVKPEVANAINKIDTLSHEDIDRLTMPLPWYLVALHRMKHQKEKEAQEAMILANIKDSVNPDPTGWMAEWNQGDCYYPVTQAMSIQIFPGTLVWFPESGGVWIETTFVKQFDDRMAALPPITQMTKTQYTEAYRARINKKL